MDKKEKAERIKKAELWMESQMRKLEKAREYLNYSKAWQRVGVIAIMFQIWMLLFILVGYQYAFGFSLAFCSVALICLLVSSLMLREGRKFLRK